MILDLNRIAVIGYGRLGSLLANSINVNSLNIVYPHTINEKHSPGNDRTLTRIFQSCDIILLCVPISALTSVLERIKPFIEDHHQLVDFSSVKMYPQELAIKFGLEKQMSLTHPLFGPNTTPNGIAGSKIVICNELPDMVCHLLFNHLGLAYIHATPEEHDRAMAYSQVLNHLVGRAASMSGVVKSSKFNTPTHEHFLSIMRTAESNSVELFKDMNKFNPFAAEARQAFMRSLTGLENDLV